MSTRDDDAPRTQGTLRQDLLIVAAIAPVIVLLALAAGPLLGVGAIVGAVLAAAVFVYPMIGLTLMILGGTALQVLGSEHITGLPVSLGKVAGLLTLMAWLSRSLLQRTPLTYSPQLPALFAFTAAMLLSAVITPDKATAGEGLFRYAQLFLLYFMIASLAGESHDRLDQTCLALSGAMVVSVVIGILEFFLPSLALDYEDPSLVQGAVGAIIDRDSIEGVEIKRVTGGLSDSNWFAYTLACVLPLNLYLFHRYRDTAMRALILLAAALQSFGIVLSYTRTGVLALGVVVLVLVAKKRLPLGPILAAGIVGAVGIVLWNPPGLQRLFSPQYLQEGSTPLRQHLLKGGIELIIQNPVFGYGYSQYGPAFVKWLDHQQLPESVEYWSRELEKRVDAGEDRLEWVMPHNTILQIWVEYGLFGIAAFAAFFAFILHDLNVARRYGSDSSRELADGLIAATLGFFVCAMFGHLALLKIIWILAGLSAALRRVALAEGAMAGLPVIAPPAPVSPRRRP